MIRVVIADDHRLVREGIRLLLEKSGDIEVVGEANSGDSAVDQVRRLKPDVLVTDIAMPGMNGLEAVEQVRRSEAGTEVVILSMYSSEIMVRQALESGARAYLLKDSLTDELLTAVRAAHRGATYFSPKISDALLGGVVAQQTERDEPGGFDQLTPRELEVMRRICSGDTNQAIAHRLGISVKTVERHRANLMAKLDVHNLVSLVRLAIRHGVVGLED